MIKRLYFSINLVMNVNTHCSPQNHLVNVVVASISDWVTPSMEVRIFRPSREASSLTITFVPLGFLDDSASAIVHLLPVYNSAPSAWLGLLQWHRSHLISSLVLGVLVLSFSWFSYLQSYRMLCLSDLNCKMWDLHLGFTWYKVITVCDGIQFL